MLIKILEESASAADFLGLSINLLVVINMASTAWDDVTKETITNCFKQAGFTADLCINVNVATTCYGRPTEEYERPVMELCNLWDMGLHQL